MKTIEETLRERAHDLKYNVGVIHSNPKLILEESFISGYNEAMQWRDPKEEPPESNVSVFVKYETATGKLKYGVGRYFPLGIGNDWTVEGSTSRKIIGWRPIEEGGEK
ncbi:hypothetical protein [Petrimonas sulfuriphila]|uniref:hypothetical protein n=1 Tax=Petrimonas sulfuriphila TaxID=285070 RepID=UPI003EBE00A3